MMEKSKIILNKGLSFEWYEGTKVHGKDVGVGWGGHFCFFFFYSFFVFKRTTSWRKRPGFWEIHMHDHEKDEWQCRNRDRDLTLLWIFRCQHYIQNTFKHHSIQKQKSFTKCWHIITKVYPNTHNYRYKYFESTIQMLYSMIGSNTTVRSSTHTVKISTKKKKKQESNMIR